MPTQRHNNGGKIAWDGQNKMKLQRKSKVNSQIARMIMWHKNTGGCERKLWRSKTPDSLKSNNI